jgi:hypothetical protein
VGTHKAPSAAWVPAYVGHPCADGYTFDWRKVSDAHFPASAKSRLLSLKRSGGKDANLRNSDGATFVVSNSQTYSRIELIGGGFAFRKNKSIRMRVGPRLLLDMINIECGNKIKKAEAFFSRYGHYFDDDNERYDLLESRQHCFLDLPQTIHEPLQPHETVRVLDQPRREAMPFIILEEFFEDARLLRECVGEIADQQTPNAEGLLTLPDKDGQEIQVDLASNRLKVTTNSARAFAWLQLAYALTCGLKFANCEECGAFMIPRRNTRQRCGGACNKRAERDRERSI